LKRMPTMKPCKAVVKVMSLLHASGQLLLIYCCRHSKLSHMEPFSIRMPLAETTQLPQ
jgi:hypothetical protein